MSDRPAAPLRPVRAATMPRRLLLRGGVRTGAVLGATALGAGLLPGCGTDTQDSAGQGSEAQGSAAVGPSDATASACAEPPALPESASSAADEELTAVFDEYAETSGAWSGADSTYSVPLADGAIAWLFSDTFFGDVAADGSRSEHTPFLHNSIVVQSAAGSSQLRTVVGTDADGDPVSLVPARSEDAWCWLGAGRLSPAGDLQVTALTFEKTGDGPLDFAWRGTELVTLDLDAGEVTDRAELPSASGIQWSAWLQERGGTTHVYGVEDGDTKTLHVAEVPSESLADPSTWRFWDGEDWSAEEGDAAGIRDDVANELSVTAWEDGFLLVTQDTSEPYGNRIVAATSCRPQGPFGDAVTLATMPEAGPEGTYGDESVYAYNAHEHPEQRDGSSLLVTYNVNSLEPEDLYADASIYRPRFLRIEI
jgi:hypothetical protein